MTNNQPDTHQIIADILRKYGLKTDIALIEELGSAVSPTEVNPDEPYMNSVDTNDFLDDSLMSHITDDIYYHASQRGWERCVIRVEQEKDNILETVNFETDFGFTSDSTVWDAVSSQPVGEVLVLKEGKSITPHKHDERLDSLLKYRGILPKEDANEQTSEEKA